MSVPSMRNISSAGELVQWRGRGYFDQGGPLAHAMVCFSSAYEGVDVLVLISFMSRSHGGMEGRLVGFGA